MVRMDKLLDAWRADPRVEPTVELCAMLTRASMKPGARDVIPMAFIVAFATEAIAKHPKSIDVLTALAKLYHAAGEQRHGAAVLEIARKIADDDPRVLEVASKFQMHRTTRELVSDPPPALPPPPPKAAARPPPRPPLAHRDLDAETFDAPTTPLDPPTEPTESPDPPTRTQVTGPPQMSAPSHPRRAPTTQGLAPVLLDPPKPAAVRPPPPPPPSAVLSSEGANEGKDGESNPRRSRTLLGGLAMVLPPVPPPSVAPVSLARPAPDSDGDQPTGVVPAPDFDDGGAPTAVATVSGDVFEAAGGSPSSRSPRPVEIETVERDAPVVHDQLTVERDVPAMHDLNTVERGSLEPPTIAQKLPLLHEPSDEPRTSQRDVPEIPSRRPLAAQRVPTQSKPLGPPPRPGDRGPPGPPPRPAPGPPDGIPREGDAGRPAARRLAARKPTGRGVGTDDPLMKAALARRARWQKEKDESASGETDAGPSTQAEHDVPTRNLAHVLRASRPDDSEEVPTRAGPLAPKAPTQRLMTPAPTPEPMVAPDSQTDVDSISEDAPTRTHVGSRPPPMNRGVLPPARTIDWARPEERALEATPGSGSGNTLSKQVTNVWQRPADSPPESDGWAGDSGAPGGPLPSFASEVSISSYSTDDSADTHLRPLAPLARPPFARRPDPRVEPVGPPIPRIPSPNRQSIDSEAQATNIRTYVMRPEESAAASQVDPRAPSRIDAAQLGGSGFDDTSHPAHYPGQQPYGAPPRFAPDVPRAPLADEPSSSLGDGFSPAPPGFGPPPSFGPPPVVVRGVQMGGNDGGAGQFGDMNSFFDPEGQQAQLQGSAPPPSASFDQPLLAALESQSGFPDSPMMQAPMMQDSPSSIGGPPSYPSYSSSPSAMHGPLSLSFPGGYGSSPSIAPPPPPGFRLDSQASAIAPPPRRPVGLYVALSIAAMMVAVLVGYASYLVISDYRKGAGKEAPSPTAEVDKALFAGAPGDLARAETLLGQLENDHSPAVALARVHLKILRSLDVSGQDEGLDGAMTSAKTAGLTADQLLAAEVALALAHGDLAKVDTLSAREDDAIKKDPYYELVMGAAFEMRGDQRALDRYDEAAKLEPRLMSAKVRGIRALILDTRLKEAEQRIVELPESASRTALTALDWVASRALGLKESLPRPGTLPTTAEVPRGLLAAYAATSLVDAEKADPSTLSKRGIDEADSPGVAVLFGQLALNRSDVTSAQAGARRALTMGPRYAPALKLLGRAALDLGKFDTMNDIVSKLPEEATRELRALKAYEEGDVDALGKIAEKLSDDDAAREAVVPRLDRLRGRAPLGDDVISKLATGGLLGGDLIAVDALLDRGEIVRAKSIVSSWPDAAGKPLRARRYARLLRYEGNLDEALLALSGTTSTATPLVLERMMIEAEIPSHRAGAIAKLTAKPNELDLPPSTTKMLEGYVRARDDDGKTAKEVIEGVSVPNPDTAFPLRVAAAVAFASVHDKRGEKLVKDLFAAFPQNPDVARAGAAYGLADDSKDPPKDAPRPAPTKRKK